MPFVPGRLDEVKEEACSFIVSETARNKANRTHSDRDRKSKAYFENYAATGLERARFRRARQIQ